MGYWVSWVKRHRPHNHSNETQTRQQTPDTHKLYIAAPTPRHPYPLSNPCRVVVVPQAPPHEVLFRRLGRCPPDCQSPNRNRLQIVYVPLTVHQFRSGVSDGTSLHSTSVFQMEHGCWRHSGLVFQTEHHCTLVRCFKRNTTVHWFGVSNATPLHSYRSLPTMTKAQHLLSSCSHFPAAPLCMQFQFRHKSNDPTDDKKKTTQQSPVHRQH